MIRRLPLALAVVLSVSAVPAQAQAERENPTGSRVGRPKQADIPDDSSLNEADRGRVTGRQFADCVVADRSRRVKEFFAMNADLEETDNAQNKLASSDCLRAGWLQMPLSLYRGALFRSAYFSDFRDLPRALASNQTDYATMVSNMTTDRAKYYVVSMDFAQCVVRSDLANSVKYIRSYPGSTAEKDAFAALMPQLGPCLVEGSEIALNKSMLEAVLSEAIYREAEAAASSNTSPEATK